MRNQKPDRIVSEKDIVSWLTNYASGLRGNDMLELYSKLKKVRVTKLEPFLYTEIDHKNLLKGK